MNIMASVKGMAYSFKQDVLKYSKNPIFSKENTVHSLDTADNIPMETVESSNRFNMKVVKPDQCSTATEIGQLLLNGDSLIINCEDTRDEVAERVNDFLAGCAYVLNASVQSVSKDTFMVIQPTLEIEKN